jgi:hypothetical protein
MDDRDGPRRRSRPRRPGDRARLPPRSRRAQTAGDIAIYLDQRGDERQQSALETLFAGGRGQRALVPFPWAATTSRNVEVRSAPIDADHHAGHPWFDAGGYVSVRVGDPICDQPSATSLIPGHPQAGIERRGTRLRVADHTLAFEPGPIRAFASTFSYTSDSAE